MLKTFGAKVNDFRLNEQAEIFDAPITPVLLENIGFYPDVRKVKYLDKSSANCSGREAGLRREHFRHNIL